MSTPHPAPELPYRIAVLCYLYDGHGHVLLLHRRKNPNAGMFSPIGGKLDTSSGEGPHECARREILEEAGIDVDPADIRLAGIVSERAYEGQTHWLIFCFEIMRPIERDEITSMTFDEGALEWKALDDVPNLRIPYTDRHVMWPLVQSHRGGFFAVHIDCTVEPLRWWVTESVKAAPV
jgi:8-oxo-dGTP diphosphatase